ncbi:uncharacterized protein DUF402 [Streptomyces sp. Amel2xB2]|nr:uncharacterized protein DUF402 [Streptomyces sp. Amel2xB2]
MTAETAGASGAAGRNGATREADVHETDVREEAAPEAELRTADRSGSGGTDGARRDADRSEGGEGGEGGTAPHRWAPGTRVLWRYRANGTGRPHICRPVTVVRDTPELLAAWVAPGTVCVKPEMADGTPVHHEPLATRYTRPRRTVLSRWFGTGVLKLAVPGEPWSVWLFWERDWQFKNWYVNLEEPHRRWDGGIDSEDHFLDIALYPDRSWEWRDEDEFAAARQAGLVGDALAARVREAGREVVERIAAWAPPFRDGWEDWRPDPRWPVPALPADWDGHPPPGAPTDTGTGIGTDTGAPDDNDAYAPGARTPGTAAPHNGLRHR